MRKELGGKGREGKGREGKGRESRGKERRVGKGRSKSKYPTNKNLNMNLFQMK